VPIPTYQIRTVAPVEATTSVQSAAVRMVLCFDKIIKINYHASTSGPILLAIRRKKTMRNCVFLIFQANGLVLPQWRNRLCDHGVTDRAFKHVSNIRHERTDLRIHEESQSAVAIRRLRS
jgi:hypothetical protein